MIRIIYIFIVGLLTSSSTFGQSADNNSIDAIILDTSEWYDQNRQREIPIAIYKPKTDIAGKQKVVVFSHGYGQNKGGDYLAYSYLTEFLASKGYFVVSIQHELATDSLLPLTEICKSLDDRFGSVVQTIFYLLSTNLKRQSQIWTTSTLR